MGVTLQAQPALELQKEEDGIKVYTVDNPNSDFKGIKGTITINSDYESFHKLVTNCEAHKEIFPNSMGLELLEEAKGKYLIYYSAFDAPWPLDDREGVYKMNFDFNPSKRVYYVRSVDGYKESRNDRVRLTDSETKWIVIESVDGRLSIEHIVFASPGGDIPSWLANSVIIDQPINTLKAIRDKIDLRFSRN